MNEGIQPKSVKDHSLMWCVIMCAAMLLIAVLFGSVPVLISYRGREQRRMRRILGRGAPRPSPEGVLVSNADRD
jgi:hypothetical protein